jgi:hypothetical protein
VHSRLTKMGVPWAMYQYVTSRNLRMSKARSTSMRRGTFAYCISPLTEENEPIMDTLTSFWW